MFPDENDTDSISVQDLDGLLGQKNALDRFALVDCREQDEFEICHLEGAMLIPLSEFTFKAEGVLQDKTRELIVYCHHGMRSSQAVTFLRKKGFSKAFSVTGGIDAWSSEIDPEVPKY